MSFRELTMIDVREALRRWQAGQSARQMAREGDPGAGGRATGVDQPQAGPGGTFIVKCQDQVSSNRYQNISHEIGSGNSRGMYRPSRTRREGT